MFLRSGRGQRFTAMAIGGSLDGGSGGFGGGSLLLGSRRPPPGAGRPSPGAPAPRRKLCARLAQREGKHRAGAERVGDRLRLNGRGGAVPSRSVIPLHAAHVVVVHMHAAPASLRPSVPVPVPAMRPATCAGRHRALPHSPRTPAHRHVATNHAPPGGGARESAESRTRTPALARRGHLAGSGRRPPAAPFAGNGGERVCPTCHVEEARVLRQAAVHCVARRAPAQLDQPLGLDLAHHVRHLQARCARARQ
mmetsp:Transcript_9139/g.22512  ORF Transcript_9139/g.22512 Transcript_9139/m.22512 type:complete len:251 (-) Transcript_9139:1383-2135(-)